MIKCTILLPITDNNGELFQDIAIMLDHAKGKLYRIFGGYTDCGIVNGAYEMADGSRADDVLRKIIVCVNDETGVTHLRDVCSRLARLFSQETLYLEVDRGARVEFVKAAPSIGPKLVKAIEGIDKQTDKPACEVWRDSPTGKLYARGIEKAKKAEAYKTGQGFDPPQCQIGSQEYKGELSYNEVARFKRAGATVEVYRHHGTVATVVRWPDANEPVSHGGCELRR